MMLNYFLYIPLVALITLSSIYAFDATHIKERIDDTLKTTTPTCIKKEDNELTKVLLAHALKNGKTLPATYQIGYAYHVTKSGVRLTTSLEASHVQSKVSLFGIDIPTTQSQSEFGYVYDNHTLCMFFIYVNSRLQKKFDCSCTTTMEPYALSEFFEKLQK